MTAEPGSREPLGPAPGRRRSRRTRRGRRRSSPPAARPGGVRRRSARLRFEAGLVVKAAAVLAVLAVLLVLRAMYFVVTGRRAGGLACRRQARERLAKGEPMARRRIPIRMRATSASAARARAHGARGRPSRSSRRSRASTTAASSARRLVPASAAADDLALAAHGPADPAARCGDRAGTRDGLAAVDAAGATARALRAPQVAAYARGDPAHDGAARRDTTADPSGPGASVADPQEAALRRGDAAAARALQADTAHVCPYVLAVRTAGLGAAVADHRRAAVGHRFAGPGARRAARRAHRDDRGGRRQCGRGDHRRLARDVPAVPAAGAVRSTRVADGTSRAAPSRRSARPELADLSRGVELMRTRLVAALPSGSEPRRTCGACSTWRRTR